MVSATSISDRIIDAVLSQQLEPNARLGEQELATLFGCSRTIVREAMVKLSTQGIVTVSSRRGWYLTQVTFEGARELYDAREIIETGLLRNHARQGSPMDMAAQVRLRGHLEQQRASLGQNSVGRRSYLLGDFHVCLAECLGNRILAQKLRELTVLTTLFTMRHQTVDDAQRSYDEHVGVVDALFDGENEVAEQRMREHLASWEEKVHADHQADPLSGLRRALAPRDTTSAGLSADADTSATGREPN